MKTFLSLLTAGLLCISFGLVAGESTTTEQFNKLDKDRNGTVSINEATGQLQILRMWTDIDTNRDGVLESAEFSAFESAIEYVPDNSDTEDNLGAAPHK